MQFRAAEDGDTVALAHMWHKGWHEGHAAHVPAALVALRTVAEFEGRTASHLAQTTVMELDGQIAGFHMLEGDEIYQFYVGAGFRGTGAAKTLMRHAEAALAGRLAWLACAVGNARAARFYEKSGWQQAATFDYHVETASGPMTVSCWRYEKYLPPES
ncbi:GNAT family N-acetyltransferase [Sulfitobacter geojensis]|uniref:GNAT family N-acetyltransferase n=1 Tax=Sulfitobacter geojensis TaxID=1342299 RepID=UPI003B8DFE92